MTVCVFNTERIGDAMIALPAVRSFLAYYPSARAIVVTDSATEALYRSSEMFSAVYHFRYRGASPVDMLRVAQVLRKERIDVMLVVPGGFFAACIAFFAGVAVRVGLDSDMRGMFLTHRVRPVRDDRHRMQHFLDLLVPLGIPVRTAVPAITVPRKDVLPPSRAATVAIAPFTRDDPRRMYPLHRWNTLIDLLVADGKRVVIAGSREEAAAHRVFLDGLSAKGVLDEVGKHSLLDTARIFMQCDAVIANDSGLMHLSAALGVPTVALFGATRKEKAGPCGPHTRIVESPYPCPPCDAKADCVDAPCMDAIDPSVVLRAMCELLSTPRA